MTETQLSKPSIVMIARGSFKVSVENCSELGLENTMQAMAMAPHDRTAATHVNLQTTQNRSRTKMAAVLGADSVTTQNGGCTKEATSDVQQLDLEAPTSSYISGAYFGRGMVYWSLMISCSLLLFVGTCAATLLGRLYFIHGGSQRWLYTCMQSVGWPFLLPPLFLYYRLSSHPSKNPTPLTFKLFSIYLAMGFFTAFDNLLFSWGLSYLPVSTNALLCASQLAFNALFAYAIVGQRITQYVINAVFAITVGAILLGLHSGSDRPLGTTKKQYILGFIVTICGAALYALMLPLMELTYRKVIGKTNFGVVVEAQLAIAILATCFAVLGMGINGEFHELKGEANNFSLGPSIYVVTLVGSAIAWQMFFLGTAGIIFLASSLLSCVFATAMLPLLSVLAVVFFHDSFSSLKVIAMLISIWGFISYIYGGYVEFKSSNSSEHQ